MSDRAWEPTCLQCGGDDPGDIQLAFVARYGDE
jgi:hypothetical protein